MDLNFKAWFLSGLLAVIQALFADAFFWMVGVLVVTMALDWLGGRRHYRSLGRFSRTKSKEGTRMKLELLTLLALLRTVEAILPKVLGTGDVSTHGVLAMLVATAVWVDEVDSVGCHREKLGRKPIPLLGWALNHIRAVTGGERRRLERTPEE